MILKVLLVLGVIGIVYFLFIKKKPLKNTTQKKQKHDTKAKSNDMVECSECGAYAELSESIISNNKYFCSDECVGRT